jgi:hypothetical protein
MKMVEQVEISSFDLRFEGYRLKNKAAERVLLASILENGIRDPLQGVDSGDARILLNGFKRYRCARKLNIGIAPYCRIADDEAAGIIELLRTSNAKSLSILEQAKLIDELKNVHRMATKDVADLLEKSKAWVSVRSGIVGEISPPVMARIMSGQFPVYAWMYILRPFIRINKIQKKEIDEFVDLVAGKGLSIRDIETLAHGYFKGPEQFRRQMRDGDIAWGLNQLKKASETAGGGCSTLEQGMLKDLEITQKYMSRVVCKSKDGRFKTGSFYAQANLITGGILRQMDIFNKAIREFHDRTGKTQGDMGDAHRRRREAPDSAPFGRRSKDGRRNHQTKG